MCIHDYFYSKVLLAGEMGYAAERAAKNKKGLQGESKTGDEAVKHAVLSRPSVQRAVVLGKCGMWFKNVLVLR